MTSIGLLKFIGFGEIPNIGSGPQEFRIVARRDRDTKVQRLKNNLFLYSR